MKILFLQTGGTIDKVYPKGIDHHGYGFMVADPAFERVLQRVNPGFEYETKTVIQKDSLDITDDDRSLLLQTCKDSLLDKIVITHGTDTMLKTAEVLSQIKDKTIVLTGAMWPELFKESDAEFNLGTAVAAVGLMTSGVYVAMNGQVMPWNKISFNNDTYQFAPQPDTKI
jgi:L-asparaginase